MLGEKTYPATDRLRARFFALWSRNFSVHTDADTGTVWRTIELNYVAAGRRYHNLHRLEHCLAEFDAAAAEIREPDQVETAIWFHDAIYEPDVGDNEARSAALFREAARGAADRRFVDAVIALILVTTHRRAPTDLDQQFLCDIDLASFGAPWETYIEDSTGLREESTCGARDYNIRQRAFLQRLLDRPRIFFTDFFHARYENRARSNIQRYMAMLEVDQL